MTNNIFKLIGFLLGKDIDSLINEAIDKATSNLFVYSKIKHIEYLEIRKKRKFKHKI